MIISKRCFHSDNFCNTRNRRSFEKHFLLGIQNQFYDLFFLQSKSYCLSSFFGIRKILYDFFFESLFYLIFSLHFNGKIILSSPSGIQLHFLSKTLGLFLFLLDSVQFSVFKFSIFPVKHILIFIQISHNLNLLKCFLDFRRLKVVRQFLYLALVISPWAKC